MPREEMTNFGVPADKNIVTYLNKINDLPSINTTFSCSGLRKDHYGVPHRPYLVISTDVYVGDNLGSKRRYPHETHDLSLKVYRAAIQAGWYAKFTTTELNGISGMGAVYLSTKPSTVDYVGILSENVTGNPRRTRKITERAKEKITEEITRSFETDLTDAEIEGMWQKLYEELRFELVDRAEF